MSDTSYPYSQYIKSPKQLGISADGTLKTLGNDITGLIAYIDLLVEGPSKASATGQPLGNKFFLYTESQCNDIQTNKPVDRYIYLSNVPNGNIPILSDIAGSDFTQFEGLVPGILSNLSNLTIPSPSQIFSTFENGGTNCQRVVLETIDVNNNKSYQSQYVATYDIANMDPCLFPKKYNPVTNATCSESFRNQQKIPNDYMIQVYFLGIGLFLIYLALKILISKRGKLL